MDSNIYKYKPNKPFAPQLALWSQCFVAAKNIGDLHVVATARQVTRKVKARTAPGARSGGAGF